MSKQRKAPYKKSQVVKLLEAMANENAHTKFSEIPAEWLAPRKYRDDSANGLTKCIIDFVTLKKGQAERIANMGRRLTTQQTFTDVIGRQRTIGSTKWIPSNGANGTADISATIKGKSVKIEVKIGRDIQSDVQKKYQKTIEAAGGIYVIASSFEQFHDWYNKNFSHE